MDISEELKIIDKAADFYNLDAIYPLFSGGSDSLCATYIAAKHPLFKGVIHIDTGIGIPEVQDYVRETCDRFNWPLSVTDCNYLRVGLQSSALSDRINCNYNLPLGQN